MSDRYRTSARHWCEHCRCWTQGDALSIKHHETGSRHREALQAFLIDARKRKVAERRAADDTQATLAAMAAAAEAAVAVDYEREAVAFPPPPPPPPGPPPRGAQGLHFVARSAAAPFRPPPMASAAAAAAAAGGGGWERSQGSGVEGGEGGEEEDLGDGTYEVGGRHYLMGEHPSAAALLQPGAACEALWAVDGQWRAATIAGPGREVAVPNTAVRARLYTIEHSGQDAGAGGGAAARHVTELTASSLRLPLSQALLERLRGAGSEALGGSAGAGAAAGAAAAAGAPAGEAAAAAAVALPVIDGATGLGVWEAVACVPEEEGEEGGGRRGRKRGRGEGEEGSSRAHAADPSKALDALAASSRGVGGGGASAREGALGGLDAEEGGQDDALAAFNPFGGAFYKGIRISGGGGGEAAPHAAAAPALVKLEQPAADAGAAAAAAVAAPIVPLSVPMQLAAPLAPPAASAAALAGAAQVVFKARANTGKGRVRGADD